jgi:diguanylate cyclase (GGDEF)-like protein
MISIRYKAVVPVGVVATMLAVLAGLAWYALSAVVGINYSLAERFDEIEEVRQIEVDVSQLVYPHLGYLSRPDPKYKEEVQRIFSRIDERAATLHGMEEVNGSEVELLDTVRRELTEIRTLSARLFEPVKADNAHEMDALHDLATVHLAALSGRLQGWHQHEVEEVQELTEAADIHAQRFEIVSAGILILALTMMLFALWLNNRVLVQPILDISRSTAGIAKGQLQQNIKVGSNDELGTLANDINHMASSLQRLYRRMEDLASTDALTGLMNRRAFEEAARRELDAAKRYHRHLSVAMVDVDYFKQVNDSHGHGAGDAVLQWVAVKCRENLRTSDQCFRFGGEEFVMLLLQETHGDDVVRTLERCRAALEAEPCVVDGRTIPVTASFGVASFADDGGELAELLQRADSALYAAKRAGRNRVVAYSRGAFTGAAASTTAGQTVDSNQATEKSDAAASE